MNKNARWNNKKKNVNITFVNVSCQPFDYRVKRLHTFYSTGCILYPNVFSFFSTLFFLSSILRLNEGGGRERERGREREKKLLFKFFFSHAIIQSEISKWVWSQKHNYCLVRCYILYVKRLRVSASSGHYQVFVIW